MERSSRGLGAGVRTPRLRWRATFGLAVVVTALGATVSPASADPGTIDVSFGVDGALRTNLGGTFHPSQQAARRMMANRSGGAEAVTAATMLAAVSAVKSEGAAPMAPLAAAVAA